jgi:hypothetical protein
MSRIPERLSEMQSEKITFSNDAGWEDPDWLRPWPFGPVHFSTNWPTRLDGRFDTVCGKSPIYWPTTEWPECPVCPDCRAWVEATGATAPMRYETKPRD